jgi:hypothetical protein
MRPESFASDLATDWSRWVLAHGLPELPGPDLGAGESVPVAYWIGPNAAAVLHIRRLLDGDDELITETDIDLFYLVDSVWETWGGGGGGWNDDAPLARYEVPPDCVNLHGMNSGSYGGQGCIALWGEVGAEATIAEVMQAGRVTRRPVEAPTSAFVVCAEFGIAFTVRVLNAHGELLAEIEEPAGSDDGLP